MPAHTATSPLAQDLADALPDQRTAVDKALILLKSLADHGQRIGVSELARRTKLTKSTTFRLLGILERNDVVERVGSGYRLGAHLFDMGTKTYGTGPFTLQDRLLPYIADLYELTHETVHLAVLHDTNVVYVYKLHGHRPTPSPSAIGARLPASCTGVGKALLAFDPDAAEQAAAAGLAARTSHSLSDPAAFRAELDRIRRDGIAFDREEAVLGLTCVAVPVMGPFGIPVAALSVAGAVHRFDPQRCEPAIRRVAYAASRALTAARRRQSIRAVAS